MSSQTGKWREESILIICPGSQSTMAQLGCADLTPPARRFPTRMFKDEDSDDWRPYYTTKRRKTTLASAPAAPAAPAVNGGAKKDEDDQWEYFEDPDSDEGAVYPIQAGRIANMDAFLAFLDHVHSILTNTYHNTPIMLMASPQWTRPDCETVTRYIFEKTKTPALCLIHSGVATQYGLKWPNMTVVDIGFEKVDVTCIYDSCIVSHVDVGSYPDPEAMREISGGEIFTRKLLKLLEGKGFNREMAEQLKKSSVCEVLPYVVDSPRLMNLPSEDAPVPTKAAAEASMIVEPIDELDLDGEAKEAEADGVLDIANIVTSGNAREFLAKKEKEKTERARLAKKGKDKEIADAAARALRLPNSKRVRNMFCYEDLITEDVLVQPSAPASTSESTTAATGTSEVQKTEPGADQQQPSASEAQPTSDDAPKPEAPAAAEPAVVPAAPETAVIAERQIKRVRRDIEVGLERFLFADRSEIDRIAEAIYRAVQGIREMYMRPPCWENLVFVGNGARVRGLKENILQTLQARHLISPSSATMFTSELPSNMGTPTGTGSQTPTSSFAGGPPHQLPTSSSVNPLLQAATTAGLAVPTGGGVAGADGGPSHHFHSQTPTAIKLAQLPTYLSEWNKHGFEEAMFLGAQVAARLAFCLHNLDAQGTEAQRLMSLSRVDYNEFGPKGIQRHSMLG
ncbi:hypothetical protein B0T17DRAFT_486052 [Bombardia bombarda]|uniref:Uncharacterized protein n=1 Tax=Bombardia bombarda TaxID=252184 RepID=A0AA39XMM9_9PEZI|nr:hypothetical protein B0T17DRAFT_486052 [Bombardia bombarda]